MDVIVPAGNEIRIELTETGMDYLPSLCSNWNASEFRLILNSKSSLIDRDEETAPNGLMFQIGGMLRNEGSSLRGFC